MGQSPEKAAFPWLMTEILSILEYALRYTKGSGVPEPDRKFKSMYILSIIKKIKNPIEQYPQTPSL